MAREGKLAKHIFFALVFIAIGRVDWISYASRAAEFRRRTCGAWIGNITAKLISVARGSVRDGGIEIAVLATPIFGIPVLPVNRRCGLAFIPVRVGPGVSLGRH